MSPRALRIPPFWILVVATSILFSCPSIGRELSSFDGTWEGKLEIVDATSKQDSDAGRLAPRLAVCTTSPPFSVSSATCFAKSATCFAKSDRDPERAAPRLTAVVCVDASARLAAEEGRDVENDLLDRIAHRRQTATRMELRRNRTACVLRYRRCRSSFAVADRGAERRALQLRLRGAT